MTLDPYNAFLHRGADEGDWRIAVKDVIDVAGMPTTAASKIVDYVPERDATAVARLRGAGATIVGKTNTHEFAYGAITNSPHFGPARNPWNPEHITGGSSGGSAAAVAAGLCDAALGTDTAGSIRIPSAFCGITGLRPSTGLVPGDGVIPTAWSFDTVGPMAWSAEECARVLAAIVDRPVTLDPPRDVRIGVVSSLFERADPRVAALCKDALAELPGRLEPVEIPLHDEIATIAQLILLPEATTVHLPWLRTRLADYGADVRARLLAGLLLPSTAYVTGLRARRWANEEYDRHLGAYDLIVAPAMGILAPRIDAVPADFRLQIIPYNSHWNLLGNPAASVPCGFVDGLPVGLCIAGRRLEDDLVLAAAHAFQQATDWHERRPVDGASGEVLYTGDTVRP